jgi:hypothetical protein
MSHQPSTGGRRYPAPMVYQQPRGFPGGQRPLQPPTPFKTFENWNYCHTHDMDVGNTHTGMTCHCPGPLHNPYAMRTNTMGDNTTGLHRTILPSASSHIPPAPRQPQAPAATPASCKIYSDGSGDAFDDANNPLPHGPPVWTSPSAVRTAPPCCCTACIPSHTSCRNDDAVLQSVPAASKVLTVRG